MKAIVAACLLAASPAFAAGDVSPRAQLKEAVAQLQKSPDDAALREKIIALAKKLKPAPALPEEAKRRMARGTAAFQDAKSVSDYNDAATEFREAALAAPWYGDAYFNLGTTLDKAERYDEALAALKLAKLALPESEDVSTLIYKVEYRRDKKAPAVAAEKAKKANDDIAAALEGAQWRNDAPSGQCPEWFVEVHHGEVFYGWIAVNMSRRGCPTNWSYGRGGARQQAHLDGRSFLITDNGYHKLSWKGTISEDGRTVTIDWSDGTTGQSNTSTFSRVQNPEYYGFAN